jgi:hypothetical protein
MFLQTTPFAFDMLERWSIRRLSMASSSTCTSAIRTTPAGASITAVVGDAGPLAVFSQSGLVLAADGLSSYGFAAGAQQAPYDKLHILGDRCACAEIGDLTKGRALAEALEQTSRRL